MLQKLLAKIEENKDQMIDTRRYLHENQNYLLKK